MEVKKLNLEWLLAAAIIIAAIFLRTHNLEYMEFKWDEGFNSLKALEFAREGKFPLTSAVSSTGINEPPIFMYILAIPFIFTTNPVFAAGFIALLNVFGIALCYIFVREFYSKRAALITAALYAVSPWQVLFSRKIWMQELLAPFAVLFVFLLFNAAYRGKKSHIMYALLVLGLLVQLHLSSAYFIIVAVFAIAAYWKAVDKRFLAAGCLLFLASFAPYFVFQAQNSFTDVHKALELAGSKSTLHTEAFVVPFTLVGTNGFEYSLGSDIGEFEGGAIKLEILDMIQMAILLFSAAFLCLAWKNKGCILIAWLFAGTFYLAFNKTSGMPNNQFLSFFPLYFILMGRALSWLIGIAQKHWRHIAYGLVLIVVAYQMLFSLHFLGFIEEKRCIDGDYGQPYLYRAEGVENAVSKLGVMPAGASYDGSKYDQYLSQIHAESCSCVKCDIAATRLILEKLQLE